MLNCLCLFYFKLINSINEKLSLQTYWMVGRKEKQWQDTSHWPLLFFHETWQPRTRTEIAYMDFWTPVLKRNANTHKEQ
jgi:hypothetical protein